MDTALAPFMRDLETRFKRASGLADRFAHKIFHCQIRPASILTLGINPGGSPSNLNSDGRIQKDGVIAAASASFFEKDEHDILDCEWRENPGLRQLLTPLVGGDIALIRSQVVKTNLAFHRSAKKSDIDTEAAASQTAPFLAVILGLFRPALLLLAGVSLDAFVSRFAKRSTLIAPPERNSGVKQVVFAASKVTLRGTKTEALVVQLAHAAQFTCTYGRYEVAQRVTRLLEARGTPLNLNVAP